MEFAQGVSLKEILINSNSILNIDLIQKIMTQIIKGVEMNYIIDDYGNKKIIAHNDLSPGNIMVDFPGGRLENPVVKIVDYGMCSVSIDNY